MIRDPRLVALLALASMGVPPPKEELIPNGMECSSCKGTLHHQPDCQKPRGFRPKTQPSP